MVALLLGGTALVCAMLQEYGSFNERTTIQEEHNNGVTFKIKNFALTVGKHELPAAQPASFSKQPHVSIMLIVTLSTAVLALLLGPISLVKEKQPIISFTAMTLGAVAVSWHYVIIGITAGIAVVVIAIILGGLLDWSG